METLTNILLWIGTNFTDEAYYTTTKVQGVFWSLADIAIIWYMLKVADFIRSRTDGSKITLRYYFLFLSAVLTLFLPMMKTAQLFFILETAILAIQYLLLMYTVVMERKNVLLCIKIITQKRQNSHS